LKPTTWSLTSTRCFALQAAHILPITCPHLLSLQVPAPSRQPYFHPSLPSPESCPQRFTLLGMVLSCCCFSLGKDEGVPSPLQEILTDTSNLSAFDESRCGRVSEGGRGGRGGGGLNVHLPCLGRGQKVCESRMSGVGGERSR
jgi:hypothetical protein